MNESYDKKLHDSVCSFKNWAQINYPEWDEETDNGEWEIGSFEFQEMYSIILKIIEDTSPHDATGQMIDDILFGIARDNECSRIVNVLLDYPEWYSVLCRQCLETNYINAKWQFAENLKDYTGNDGLQEIIFKFLDTGDEYTERLALMSLAHIYPDESEKYVVDFWERNKFENDEYQKIMVLHVLYTIQSSQLEHYLNVAAHSKYHWLKENAKEIRRKMSKGCNSIL